MASLQCPVLQSYAMKCLGSVAVERLQHVQDIFELFVLLLFYVKKKKVIFISGLLDQ